MARDSFHRRLISERRRIRVRHRHHGESDRIGPGRSRSAKPDRRHVIRGPQHSRLPAIRGADGHEERHRRPGRPVAAVAGLSPAARGFLRAGRHRQLAAIELRSHRQRVWRWHRVECRRQSRDRRRGLLSDADHQRRHRCSVCHDAVPVHRGRGAGYVRPALVPARRFSLGYDWRDSETHPRRGGHYKAIASQYDAIDDATFDFRRVDISVQQIVPLPNRYRRIELRADGRDDRRVGGPAGPVHLSTGARRHADAARLLRIAIPRSQRPLGQRRIPVGGVVGPRRRDLCRRRPGCRASLGSIAPRISTSRMASASGFMATKTFIARLDLARSREGFHPILGFKYGF